MSNSSWQLYTRPEYFDDLRQRIMHATSNSRVLVSAMAIYPDVPQIASLIDALEIAARKGAQTHLVVDAYDYLYDDYSNSLGPLWWHRNLPEHGLRGHFAQHQAMIDRLSQSGVVCTVTNKPKRRFSNWNSGRSHIKTAVVDDYFYIGGCNLHAPSQIDVMAGRHHAAGADWIFGRLCRLGQTGNSETAFGNDDQLYPFDNHNTLLLDTGVKGQSAILQHALQIIGNAREWLVLSCQFFPTGTVADALENAMRRGVQTYVLFDSGQQTRGLARLFQQSALRYERLRRPEALFRYQLDRTQPFLHAKVLASEREAVLGSHNYAPIGVALGTTELSVHALNPQFAAQLASHIVRQCGMARRIIL